MDLVRLPSGRILNMARVMEVQDVRFEPGEDAEDRLELQFVGWDVWLRGDDRAAMLRYLGQVARDLGAEDAACQRCGVQVGADTPYTTSGYALCADCDREEQEENR